MKYLEAVRVANAHLFPLIAELYTLKDWKIREIEQHIGGRNLVYACEKAGAQRKIIRISYLGDRTRADFLAEAEYVMCLSAHGAHVAHVIPSRRGNPVEECDCDGHTFFVCLFEWAAGKLLAENNYRYRQGVPISEYYYNCGKVLGKLHRISKEYRPVHPRHQFFDKYNAAYLDQVIPASLSALRQKLAGLLATLEELRKDRASYGMVHFDYGDGNYAIDFDTGRITVFDFDDSCFCWYLYDLASVWRNGTGWIQFEPDAGKRAAFMKDYFETVLAGYRSETPLADADLEKLPLFIQVVLMENIVAEFEWMQINGAEHEPDEKLTYLIKCMEDDIAYLGFFHEIYACEAPFSLKTGTP